jgi:hypothetical protein
MSRSTIILSLIILHTLGIGPSAAGPNEDKWRSASEAKIRKGAPAKDICISAKSSGFASNEEDFIEWVYDVARQYCDPGDLGTPGETTQTKPEPNNSSPETKSCPSLSIAAMNRIAKGMRVHVNGGDCSMRFN